MNIIYKRPIVSFCIMLIAGILTAYLSDSVFVTACLFLLMSVCFCVFGAKHGNNLFVPVGMLIFFLFGSMRFLAVYNISLRSFSEYDGTDVAIKGYIASEPDIKGEKVSYIVNAEKIAFGSTGEFKPHKGKVLLTTLYDEKYTFLDYGREVVFGGMLTQPQGVRNPGGFNYRRYLAQKGVGACIFAYPYSIEAGDVRKGCFLVQAGLGIRNGIVHVIDNSLPRQQAGLLNGMLIGYRKGLSEEVQEAFSNAGLTHIMAVSGANVAFLILPLSFLFKLLRIRKRAANLLIMLFLTVFVFITGFEPSVLRAVLMACVLLTAVVIYEKPDVYASLAFSCIILLLASPCMLFHAGFQLSYAATLGIVMLHKNISNLITRCHIPGKIAEVMAATLAAQLGTLPVAVTHFNRVSLIAVIPNMLAAPLLEVITILGMLMAVFGQFSLFLSRVIGYLNNVLLSIILYITKWSSDIPFAVTKTITPPLLLVGAYYVIVWYLLWYKPLKKVRLRLRHAAVILSFTAVFVFGAAIRPAYLEIMFLDIGQGDSAFIRTYSGKTVLIDGGGSSDPTVDSNIGERVLIPFLLDSGVGRLDAVIATHPHSDHIQGLVDVLEQIKTDRLIIPSMQDETGFRDLLHAASSKNIAISRCARGDIIRLDGMTTMQVLNPEHECDSDEKSLNNASLVIKLCYGHTSFLFTGDIEAEAEDAILKEAQDLNADLIKIAHHGSSTSTGEAFLNEVDPEVAIISVGRNSFGHPSDEVLQRIEKSSTQYFRTDECGAVIVRSNGKDIRIRRTVK